MKARLFSNKIRQLGQGMTEYIIIVALIAIAAIGVFTFFGGTVRAQVGAMNQELTGQSGKEQMQRAVNLAQAAKDESVKPKTLGDYENKQKTD